MPWEATNLRALHRRLSDKGDPAILEQIIRGGLDQMKEANCAVIGGHSIRNDDIQFSATPLLDNPTRKKSGEMSARW